MRLFHAVPMKARRFDYSQLDEGLRSNRWRAAAAADREEVPI